MSLTNLAAFRGLFNRKPESVDVDGVGAVFIRKLSAGEVASWQSEIIGPDLKPTRDGLFRADAAIVSRSISDEAGAPVFASTTQVLDELPPHIVRALAKAAREVNKINVVPGEGDEGNDSPQPAS